MHDLSAYHYAGTPESVEDRHFRLANDQCSNDDRCRGDYHLRACPVGASNGERV